MTCIVSPVLTTRVSPEVLRAALRRSGVWVYCGKHETARLFYHRQCAPTGRTPVGWRELDRRSTV